MAVQVAQPQGKKRDLIDVVMAGLQAASAYTNIQKASAELDAIPEAQERARRLERQQFAATFQEVPEGTQGAASLTAPSGKQGLYLPRSQVAAGGKAKSEKFERENKLRDKWLNNPQTKVSQNVSLAVGKIRRIGEDEPSAAGDLALIYNFMKLQDPTSTVLEGEFATAQNAAGVPAQVLNLYNRVNSGERLNPSQRFDFVNRADQLYRVHWERQKSFNDEFERIAKEAGLDPKSVVLDLKFEPPPKAKIPGSTQDIEILNKNLSREFDAKTVITNQPFDPDQFLRE